MFFPSVTVFHIWHRKGLKSFADLCVDGQFASVGTAALQCFCFLQVTHYVQTLTVRFPQNGRSCR